jgi:hypothetical protein
MGNAKIYHGEDAGKGSYPTQVVQRAPTSLVNIQIPAQGPPQTSVTTTPSKEDEMNKDKTLKEMREKLVEFQRIADYYNEKVF